MAETKRTHVYLPPDVKERLEKMAEATGISQTQLITLATTSMVYNYEVNGKYIFLELLDSTNKKSPSKEEN